MRAFKRECLVALAVGAAAACGGGGGPSPESLTGSWSATKAEIVQVSSPSTKVDLVAMGGTLSLVLTAAKTFTLTVSIPGEPVEQAKGTWSSSSDVLTLTYSLPGPPYGEMQFDMSLSGSTLTLLGASMSYDFNDDGVEEDGKANLTLVRQP